jgi:hypothetical protein
MNNLTFDDGLREFKINNDENRVIRFNPTDSALISRLQKCEKEIQTIFETYQNENAKEEQDEAQIFDNLIAIDERLRTEVNKAFESDVCTIVFGSSSLWAFNSGQPILISFLQSVINACESALKEEQNALEAKVVKYTKKYD